MSYAKIVCIFSVLWIYGCGFVPLYDKNCLGNVHDKLQSIKIKTILNREGQLLKNYLEDRMCTSSSAEAQNYILESKIIITKSPTGFSKDGSAQYQNMKIRVNVTLMTADKKVLYKDYVERNSSISVGEKTARSRYLMISSERESTKKILASLAEEIYIILTTYYKKLETNK